MKVTDVYGNKIDFEIAVLFMDDDIREEIHSKLSPCTAQEFYNAYAREHEKRFGEVFCL